MDYYSIENLFEAKRNCIAKLKDIQKKIDQHIQKETNIRHYNEVIGISKMEDFFDLVRKLDNEDDKKVVSLRYMSGLTHAEAATSLCVSVQKIVQVEIRAIKKMKNMMSGVK